MWFSQLHKKEKMLEKLKEPRKYKNLVYMNFNIATNPGKRAKVYDILKVVPEFISTYNSRKFAFPHLVQKNDKEKFVLFGGMPKNIDKKVIIWELVAKREPQITWLYTKNNTLKKECYDQSDAYCAILGYMKMEGFW